MKKVLRIVLYVLGVVALLVLAFGLWVQFSPLPAYSVAVPDLEVPADSALIAEGARMAELHCVHCHASHNGRQVSGRRLTEAPPDLGTFWAPNITSHPGSRLAGYTDGELAVLLRTGIQRDGRWLPGPMPAMPLLSDRDLHALIAWLRTSEGRMAPVEAEHPRSQLTFLGKLVAKVLARPVAMPSDPIPEPDTTDPVAWGYYLAAAKYDCYNCHSADFATNLPAQPEASAGYFGGGNKLINPMTGKVIYSANLTMHPEHGIGAWTRAQFAQAVRFGQHPDGRSMRLPMRPYTVMTEAEAEAIWAYLQTVPVQDNEVDRTLD